ncbi:hypothetical protein EIN_060370 [Entamoeba invadens IP1]|uniref:hypothetical protein n=1 Tax=Entamoeba invadens IP1 TaxID=370355 RepID=UPI0002C3EE29|nr:hypothetical protein EIN_060370 [Entamoeba invadens IP1]ELP93512.1 hypothetical protein EIN_060370 [Entamoeba invadens IP1]|eukprot:XP_004260283.1 hypothetical protein EIN_060370 [Entamoeba invadens IP1]
MRAYNSFSIHMDEPLTGAKKQSNKSTKIMLVVFIVLTIIFGLSTLGLAIYVIVDTVNREDVCADPVLPEGAMTPISVDIAIDGVLGGAAVYNHKFDMSPSPYYKHINVYDQKPTDTLVVLDKFETYQQTNGWSCGPSSSYMALRYMGETNVSEAIIAAETGHVSPGQTPEQLVEVFESRGYKTISSPNNGERYFGTDSPKKFVDTLLDYLKRKIPFLVKLGGHWSVVIGYDDVGKPEEYQTHVMILADSWDTHDGLQEGIIVYEADYFWNLWTNGKVDIDGRYQQFVVGYKD